MRIIQVITLGNELYGAQRHVLDLSESLKAQGHEVILLLGTSGKTENAARSIGLQTYILNHLKRPIQPIHDILGIIELIKLFKELKPDIVASHSSKAGILVRIAAWWLGIPNTFTVHGWSFAEGSAFLSRKFFQVIEKMIGWISCKVIVIAESDRQYALQLGILKSSQMKLIYHGIRLPEVDNTLLLKKNEKFTMVMAARFQAQKDHDTLIAALVPLKKNPWQLFLLGDGELMTDIKNKVKEEGLNDKIHFEGAVDNVADYLVKADVFLLITNWEGLPISILEAMSYSLPVIASNVAGVKEEIEHFTNGILVPRKGVKEVTDAINLLYSDEELRRNMGKKSKEIFDQKFRIDVMTKETLQLYEEIQNENNF